jgi:hypothetical protein
MHVSLYEHELHRLFASPVLFLLAHPACAVHTHSLSSPHTNLQHFIAEALGCRVSEPPTRGGRERRGGRRLGHSKLLPLFGCLQVIRQREPVLK